MTRHSLRIAVAACGVVALFVIQPGAVAQISNATRAKAATSAAARPAAAAAAPVAKPAAQVSPHVLTAAQYALPVNAAERAAVTAHVSQGDCMPPTTVMSVSRMFDNRPLERPKPLVILKGDRDSNLGRVSAVLVSNGFAQVSNDVDGGELLVSRADDSMQGAHDDLLIWAEGQAGDANRIRVYLQYGRFEGFFGEAPRRVVTTTEETQKRIGVVRQAIVNLATGAQ